MSGVAKIRQLQTKLANTAATERKLLTPGDLFVNRTITTAAKNGRSRTYQGSALIILSPANNPVVHVEARPDHGVVLLLENSLFHSRAFAGQNFSVLMSST